MKTSSYTMYFDNPHQYDGLNYTIRLGAKWASRVKPGDRIEIEIREKDRFTIATVVEVIVLFLGKLIADYPKIAAYSHDPRIRAANPSNDTVSWETNMQNVINECVCHAYYDEVATLVPNKLEQQIVTCIGYIV